MKALALRALVLLSLLFLGYPTSTQAQPTPGVQYVSPTPGSLDNPAATAIALRYGDSLNQNDFDGRIFVVSGTTSGPHGGTTVLSDDGQTIIYKPDQPFTAGETVNVQVNAWTSATNDSTYPAVAFSFTVAPAASATIASTTGQLVPQDSAPPAPGEPSMAGHYATLPADFPNISVVSPANGTAPGLIFATNFQTELGPSGYYLLILDDHGEPVFYQKLPANSRSLDFKEQPDGTLSYSDFATNAFVIMDNQYRVINMIRPGNGFTQMDEHDLQALPNGHYLLLASEARTMDMSVLVPGGNAQASVTGQIIQELDRNKNVVFQWRSLDYIPVTDTTESLTAPLIDFSHSNALALDSDGNLLLSSRHLDEITKIDHKTGAIIWRLGGKENQFNFALAPGIQGPAEFYHQHDIRRLANGHITVFDNHTDHDPKLSRALEYTLDENARTATLVWAYATTPPPYAIATGSVQRLANGNTFIGWGTNLFPQMTEVHPDGTKALELDFGGTNITYRAFRFPWHGYPAWPPMLAPLTANNAMTLTVSWNGATDVAAYQFYGGNTLPPNNLVGQQSKTGFETHTVVPDALHGYCFYQAVPIDAGGKAMRASAVVMNQSVRDPSCFGKAAAQGQP